MRKIFLQEPSFNQNEINSAIEVLNSTYLTMGKKCKEFERTWTLYQESKYSTFVNSGSSANLLIASLLKSKRGQYNLKSGDEILIPALTWSTTLFPFIQLGFSPVLVDVNPKTFNISIESCNRALSKNTKAIFIVHLLGNPCNMEKIQNFCMSNNLILIEDCCEAVGAEWEGEKVGNFGIASSFSFMFAHHMTTIEGGMISCKFEIDSEILKAQRAHGWIRELSSELKEEIVNESNFDDDRFVFWDLGYNLRPNEINAVFGLHQLTKLESFIKIRKKNFKIYKKCLKDLSDKIQIQELECENRSQISNFAFGIVIKDNSYKRSDLYRYLINKNIESRPLVGGNLSQHPFYDLYLGKVKRNKLDNSQFIHENGLYLPNHQGINENDIYYICEQLNSFFDA